MVTVQMSYENLGNFPRFEITLLQLNLTAFPTIKKPNLQEFDKFLTWNAKMKWPETEIMSTTNLPIGQLKSSTRYSSCRCWITACSSQKCKLHSTCKNKTKKGKWSILLRTYSPAFLVDYTGCPRSIWSGLWRNSFLYNVSIDHQTPCIRRYT